MLKFKFIQIRRNKDKWIKKLEPLGTFNLKMLDWPVVIQFLKLFKDLDSKLIWEH